MGFFQRQKQSLVRKGLEKYQRKQMRKYKLFAFLIVAPMVFTFVSTAAFFAFDEFNYYVLLFANKETAQGSGFSSSYGSSWDTSPDSWSGSTPGGSGSGSSGQLVPGIAGLRAMYVNHMQGGYYREYLEIVKNHVNWTYMPDEVSPILDQDGEPVYPTIFVVLGTGLAETGLATPNRVAPYSVMDEESYQYTEDFTLYKFNSYLLREYGESHIAGPMGMSLRWNYYYTPFQFTHNMAAVWPDGDYDTANKYPSKLNGYGISQNTKRTLDDTDAAYFPDIVSIILQYTCASIPGYMDETMLSVDGITAACYPMFNGGAGIISNTWAVGGRASTSDREYQWTPVNNKFPSSSSRWHESNTLTKRQCASLAVNKIAELANECLYEMVDSIDPTDRNTFYYANHEDYEGLATVALLMNGGFLATDHARLALTERSAGAGFMRGAVVGYRIFSGDASATQEEVKAWLDSITVTPIDEGFYGPAAQGKAPPYVSYNEIMIHMYNEDYTVYNIDGEGPRPLLHAFNLESTRGAFMSVIGGPYVYWSMLMAAGVECTMMQALADGLGAQISSNETDILGYYSGARKFGSWVPGSDEMSKMTSMMVYRTFSLSPGIHYGEDFVATVNGGPADLAAVAKGTVVENSYMGGRGYYVTVEVETGEGNPKMYYLYQHLTESYVEVGQEVEEGDIIALSGKSGGDYAIHLHLELWVYRGDGNTKYCLPFASCFLDWCTPETAPGVIWGPKASDGAVYDKNLNYLGTLRAVSENSDGSGTLDDYRRCGPNAYLEQALAAS